MKLLKFGTISCLFTLVACSPKYYVPNTQNVPQLTKQGDVRVAAAGNGSQVELQAAYAFTDHFGMQLNGAAFKQDIEDSDNGGSGNLVEIGPGYYCLGENNISLGVYALGGFGSMENQRRDTSTLGNLTANVFRYGLQPAVGYRSKYFSVVISSRFVAASYSNIKGNLVFEGENQQDYLSSNPSIFLIEPALTLRGGLEYLKAQLQFGKSFVAGNSSFPHDDTWLTVGLQLELDSK